MGSLAQNNTPYFTSGTPVSQMNYADVPQTHNQIYNSTPYNGSLIYPNVPVKPALSPPPLNILPPPSNTWGKVSIVNAAFTDSNYSATPVSNLGDCPIACASDENCNRWIFNENSRNCQLIAGPPYTVTARPGALSGFVYQNKLRNTPPTSNILQDYIMTDNPSSSKSPFTANDCQSTCQNASNCTRWSYDPTTSQCMTYTGNPEYITGIARNISGYNYHIQ